MQIVATFWSQRFARFNTLQSEQESKNEKQIFKKPLFRGGKMKYNFSCLCRRNTSIGLSLSPKGTTTFVCKNTL